MRKVHLLVICNACHESEVMELYRITDGKWSALMADGNLADLGWLETDDGDLCPFCHQEKIDADYEASKEAPSENVP